MTANQIAFARLREDARAHRVTEEQGWGTLYENVRSHKANESINWFNAATDRSYKEGMVGIGWQNAAANMMNAESNAKNAATNAKNAETNFSNYTLAREQYEMYRDIDYQKRQQELYNLQTHQQMEYAQMEYYQGLTGKIPHENANLDARTGESQANAAFTTTKDQLYPTEVGINAAGTFFKSASSMGYVR